ncbi:MAG: hypothetical protein ACREAA_00220 [Candidatus Polarisedimenticolia bacterium]
MRSAVVFVFFVVLFVAAIQPAAAQCPPARLGAVVEASANELSWINTTGAPVLLVPGLVSPTSMVLNGARTLAYVLEGNGELSSYNFSTGAVTLIASGIASPSDLALAPSETVAYVSASAALSAVDLATGAITLITTGLTGGSPIAVNPAGTTAYVTIPPCCGTLASVNLTTGAITTLAAGLPNIYEFALNTAGTRLYWVDGTFPGGPLRAWNFSSSSVLVFGASLNGATQVTLNAAGNTAFVHVQGDGELASITIPAGVRTAIASGTPSTESIALNAGETAVQALSPSGEILSVDVGTGAISVIRESLTGPLSMAVNATQRTAFVGEGGGQLSAVDLITGGITRIPATLLGDVNAVALNSSQTVAYVGVGPVVLSVNLSTGATSTIATLPGAGTPGMVTGLAINPAGTLVYATQVLGALSSVNLATGAITPIVAGGGGLGVPNDIVLNAAGTTAFVPETGTGEVSSVALATGVVTLEGAGLTSPNGIDLNAAETLLYVTEGGSGELSTVNIATGVVTPVTPGLTVPAGVSLATPNGFAAILPSRQNPSTGGQVAACTFVNAQSSGEPVGGYGLTLSWDPNVLSFAYWTPGDPPFNTPVVNTSEVASGTLRFADTDTTGACVDTHPLCAAFDVIGAGGSSSPLNLDVTSLFTAGTFTNLTPTATERNAAIQVPLLCISGDVNGDNAVNSGDALIILSDEIGLPIPAGSAALIAAGCGDANGDSATDSIDANVILTYEVGLPVGPGFPVGTPLSTPPTFDACPACSDGTVAPATSDQPSALRREVAAALTADPGPVERQVAGRLTALPEKPKRGQVFDLTISLDMNAALLLGSYAARIVWDPAKFEFLEILDSSTPFGDPLVNTTNAGAGELRFADAHPSGVGGSVNILTVRLKARRTLPQIETDVSLSFTSMGAPGPSFENLLPALAPLSERMQKEGDPR